jgi:AraC-like DNA-binding protein
MSINQIALNVGFSTNTYFSKIFKRETNLTPKEYRERFKE